MKARKHSSTIEESAIIELIARIVSSVRATKPDYALLAEELAQAIQFDVFGVVLLRYDRAAVRIVACQRESGRWVASYHQHPFIDSKLQQICQTESPELLVHHCLHGLDGPPSDQGDALSRYHQLRSTIIAPLIVEGRILGTLELGSTDAYTYDDQECQRVVSAVARVLASAIEGAQLGGSAAIQDKQREALRLVSRSLTSKMDLPIILRQIVTGIAESLNVASAIFMYNRRKQVLTLVAQAGLDETILERLLVDDLPIRETCIVSQTVLRRRQSFVAHDITNDEHFPDSGVFFSSLGMRSIFSHPLYTENAIYGALLLCSPESGGFTPLKIDILSLFASQATIAIHNGMLLEAARQRQRFQLLIERFDQNCQQEETRPVDDTEEQAPSDEERLLTELQLLKQVRAMSRDIFGVSLHSLLNFISRNILTRDELDLHAALFAPQQAVEDDSMKVDSLSGAVSSDLEQRVPLVDTLSVLMETAESALMNAGRLGAISSLTEQLKQSGHGVNDAWFILDPQNNCTYMNSAAEAFRNMHLDEMETTSTTRLLKFPSGEGVDLSIEQVLKHIWPYMRNAGEIQEYLRCILYESTSLRDVRCVLASEALPAHAPQNNYVPRTDSLPTDRHYQLTCYPLYDSYQRLAANALQVRDVTQQVREKTNIDTLLSSVSHDLRTPLTTVKAATSGLLQVDMAWSEQDRLEMLEDIDRETDHLIVLVNALVDLSRIKMGALILEKEWCDICEVMNGAIDKVERILAGREVCVHILSKLPLVYVDHGQIEQVLYNLIENACRRSPDRAYIEVVLQVIEGDGEILQVHVMDQGTIIPEHERQRIFESYYQLRSYGNGLGLAICKGIIEAHQGDMRVEARHVDDGSLPYSGACFTFTLPVSPHYPPLSGRTMVDILPDERDHQGKIPPQAR